MATRFMVGDAMERLRDLPDASVHTCITSPPYWGLRSYTGESRMIGLEETWDEHLANVLAIMREVRRVLRPDGICWFNYGDAYAGSWGAQSRGFGDPLNSSTISGSSIHASPRGTHTGSMKNVPPGLKPKDLMQLPARISLALQDDGWWVRSRMVWVKTNPTPESVHDRPVSSYEDIYLLTKAHRYWYDAEAVRRVQHPDSLARLERARGNAFHPDKHGVEHKGVMGSRLNKRDKQRGHGRRHAGFNERWDKLTREGQQAQGANFRNVIVLATEGFPLLCPSITCLEPLKRGDADSGKCSECGHEFDEALSHFAVFPRRLVDPLLRASTSEKGCCPECGAQWTRVVEKEYSNPGNRTTNGPRSLSQRHESPGFGQRLEKHTRTIGWEPGCECGEQLEPVPATVLDPFAGAGTVGVVAQERGRHAILIEISPIYMAVARKRIRESAPMFFEEWIDGW